MANNKFAMYKHSILFVENPSDIGKCLIVFVTWCWEKNSREKGKERRIGMEQTDESSAVCI
jgi:hypothetical protein